MKFEYVYFIDHIVDLYKKPRTPEDRFFDWYLKLVQTHDKKDLQRPLPFFNPMAKDHILEKLLALQAQGFEDIMDRECKIQSSEGETLQVYFNLADDIWWWWTNKEDTREISQNIRPFIKRWFCIILFFASEDITPLLIQERVKFYTNLYTSYKNT